jgi:hypothetical protein
MTMKQNLLAALNTVRSVVRSQIQALERSSPKRHREAASDFCHHCRPLSFPCILRAFVDEETREGKAPELDDGVNGYFVALKEVALPFRPYRSLRIGGTEGNGTEGPRGSYDGFLERGDEPHFRVNRVVWDHRVQKFLLTGVLNIVAPYDSTDEAMREYYPGWEFRWYGHESFDTNGRLVEREAE